MKLFPVILSIILLASFILTGCGGGTGATEPVDFAIYDISVQTTAVSAVVTFKTTIPAKDSLRYALTGNALNSILVDAAVFQTNHSVSISFLNPSTSYDFVITAWTDDDQHAVADSQSFTTSAKNQDEPIVYGLTISNITATSAVISWFTDESSDSRVFYGLTPAYTDSSDSSTLTLSHQIALTGLVPQTQYYFLAASDDAQSFRGFSEDSTFTTGQYIYINIPDTTVDSNTDFYYPISLAAANDLGGMQFQLEFDTTYFEVASIIQGPFVIDNNHDFFSTEIDNINGTAFTYITWYPIILGDLILGTEADGGGIAAYIQFHAKSPGTSTFTFDPALTIFLDMFIQPIDGSLDDAVITIQ